MYILPLNNAYNISKNFKTQAGACNLQKFVSSGLNLRDDSQNKDIFVKDVAFTSAYNLQQKVVLQNAAETVFNRSIVFGPQEYKLLSSDELSKLREYGKYFTEPDAQIVNFILDFGKYFSKRIHEKFPEGFIFVSVGRSPAFLAKYLEFEGEKVMYCPISGLRTYKNIDYSPKFLDVFKKYLDSIGLTKEFAQNTDKTIVICDYTHEGCSLDHFRDLLRQRPFGIFPGEKVKYSPITWSVSDNFPRKDCIFEDSPFLIDELRPNRWDFDDCLYKDIMVGSRHKKYTSIPRIYARGEFSDKYAEEFEKFYQNGNRFKEDFDVKMMNFLIADSVCRK